VVPRLASTIVAALLCAATASAAVSATGDPLLTDEWWLAAVGADKVAPPGPGVPVTVIDMGVDLTHPEFAARPNTTALNPQTVGNTPEGAHATEVASVVAAPADGAGMVGIYPQAALRLWDAGSSSDGLIAGLAAASRAGPSVINISLSTPPSRAVEDAVDAAIRQGSLVVASVGNARAAGSPAQFPADIPHVLTVGAVDEQGNLAAFSNSSPYIDLLAPGTNIRVAVPRSFDPTGFAFASGTSFSAPIVAGAAAWVWTQRPELDAGQVAELLRGAARDIGRPGFDEDAGYGILEVPAALAANAPAPDTREPNDDIALARALHSPLIAPTGARRVTVSGWVESFEDPRDVYQAWVPAGGSLAVTLSGDPDVNLEVWRPGAFSVKETGQARRIDLASRSAKRGAEPDFAVVVNKAPRGAYFDVAVLPAPYTRRDAYTLTLIASARP
jgi:subtilisin family serine protease